MVCHMDSNKMYKINEDATWLELNLMFGPIWANISLFG